jgi:hypothetical protein
MIQFNHLYRIQYRSAKSQRGYHLRARFIPPTHHPTGTHLLRRLLLQIRLDTALSRLALIMLLLRLHLLPLIACQSRNRTTHRAPNPIANTLTQIIHLPSSLLSLTLFVLLNTLLLETLCANEAAERFFGGADVLIP